MKEETPDKSLEKTEVNKLPELLGNLPVGDNPVDIYLSGKSRHTQRMVRSHMTKIALLFGYANYRQAPWSNLRYHHVKELIGVLSENEYAPSTINAILAAIRGVAKSAFNLYQLDGDDLERIRGVSMVRGSRLKSGRIVPSGELTALVNVCQQDTSPAGIRDISIIGALFIGGMRRSEVVSLQLTDLQLEQKELRFIGKGNKERKVFLDSGTQAALKDWLSLRGRHEGALFCPILKNGRIISKQLTDQSIYTMLQKRWKQAGIPPVAPHDFRRTFISKLLSNGIDVLTVQRMAGHSDPRITSGYDLRPDEDMKSAASQLHLPYYS